ncbi:MAG: glycosyltransferase family 39 protein [Gemmatimonadaceae bacterium]
MTPIVVGGLALAIVATVATLAGAAAALRRPLWLDEIVTQLVARGPAGILHAMRSGVDFQPPPHYLLVAASEALAGAGALAARLPSVIAAAFTIVLLGAALRTRLSVTAALAGALALAAHPLFTSTAIEARPYALWILASALLAESLRTDRRHGAWLVGAAAVALCTSHYFGVLTLVAVGMAALAHARWARRLSWPAAARAVAPLTAGAGALLLLLPLARAQLAATSGRSWVAPGTAGDIASFLRFAWGWRPAMFLIAAGALLFVARRLPVVAARWPRRDRRALDLPVLALLATAAVPLFVVAVTLTYKPVLVLRYTAPAVLAVATLCALAVESFPRRVRLIPLLLLLRAAAFSYQSMAHAAQQETAAFEQESQAVRLLAGRGIPTVSPFRHDAYRASLAAGGAPAVAWIELPDSLLERVAAAGVPSLGRNLLLVERDFGRAVQREFGFPAVVGITRARAGASVALLRDPSVAAADSLWLPGRVGCALSPRLVVFTRGPAASACDALQATLQGVSERR